MNPLTKVVECLGSDAALAALLKISAPAVSQWRKRGTVLKAEYCTAIERATCGQVTRRDLRPDDWQDIWPELAESPASAAPVAIKSGVTYG